METLFRVEALINHIGGTDYIDPQSEGSDDNVGSFCMFVVRDALSYCGLLPEKQRAPEREIRLALHKQEYYNGKLKYLQKMLSQIENA